MRVVARRFPRLLALGLAAAALLFLLVHAPPLKRAASRMAVALLEKLAGGTAAFQTFDYRLWRGEIRIEGFSWSKEGAAVRAREVLVRFQFHEPLEVRVEEPDVRVVLSSPPGGARRARPAPPPPSP